MHHTLKSFLQLLQVTLFIVIPSVFLWLQFVGLPQAFHPPITKAAKQQGLELEFGSMRLDLLEGLVLDKVQLRVKQLPDNNKIGIDRMALSLNWRQLLRGRVELNSLDLRGAQLYLPIASSEGVSRTLNLSRARARLILTDGAISIPLAHFNVQGIEVIATGQIILSDEGKPPLTQISIPKEVSRVLEVLETIKFESSTPTLEIDFTARSGDDSAFNLRRLQFTAEKASYDEIGLQDIRLDAQYAGSTLKVKRLSARDTMGGILDLSGQWNLQTGRAQADASSTLTPLPWLAELNQATSWPTLTFAAPPQVKASLKIESGQPPRIQVMGTATSSAFTLKGIEFEGFSGNFAWRNGDFYANDVVLNLPTGNLRADIMLRPDDVRLRVSCHADPTPLVNLLEAKAQAGLAKMELVFIDPPEIQFEARGTKLDPDHMTAQGKLRLGKTSIHNSSMEGATADLTFKDLALTLSHIEAERPEGTARGAFTYDFGRKQVLLTDISSGMNPFNVLQWADPNVAKEVKAYRFKAPPRVTVNGVIVLKNPTLNRVRADFIASEGLDYDLLEKTLSFGRTSGSLQFTGRQVAVDVPKANLYGGQVNLTAQITTGQAKARQEITVGLEAVNFETLTRLYFDYEHSQGLVSGRYDFNFIGGQPDKMRGQGNMRVEDGNVFAIPLLGPLTTVLNSIIPGAGYQTAREATCDFRVFDGEIRTDNLDVIGQGFGMIGAGSLYFLRDAMDFSVRINAQGVPGLILYPVSKLFEYVSDGKLSQPEWRPKVLPKNPGRQGSR